MRSSRLGSWCSTAAAAVAGAVVLWFVEGGSAGDGASEPAKSRASLTPSVGPSYAGAALGVSV